MSCKHPSLFQNMCVVCGVRVQQTAPSHSGGAQAGAPTNYKLAMNVSGGKVLQLSAEEAASVTASKVNNLKNSKKLALVLDLDHTLLHAVQIEGQTPSRTAATPRVIDGTKGIGSGDGSEDNVVHHLPIEEIDRFVVKHLVMKKRPFLDEFLEKASEFCQMTVYTAGTRRYAEAVAKVLDPSRKYFADRIVARCDVANVRADGNDKSLERIYPGDASMAVIIDDREDVWRGVQSQQLLMVKPFVHFDPRPSEASAAASQKIGDNATTPLPDALGTLSRGVATNGNTAILSPVITLCASSAGEPAGRIAKVAPLYSFEHSCLDDQLRRCLQVLLDIHAQFYSTLAPSTEIASNDGVEAPSITNASAETKSERNSADTIKTSPSMENTVTTPAVAPSVGNILRNIKKKVLAGCTLTFSGLIPTNEENPRNHTLWRLAEALGAHVSTELLPRTTHLISIHTQTLKVSAVLAKRASEVWVLHPDWLIYCRWSLSRACEATFMLNQLAPGQSQPNPPMDFSPLPPSTLSQLPPLPPPPPLSAPLIGAGTVLDMARDVNTTNGEPSRNLKRDREEEGRASSSRPTEDNSMLSALKKLRAVGPAGNPTSGNVSTASGRKPGNTMPPIPAPITNGGSSGSSGSSSSSGSGVSRSAGGDRGPSPVIASSSRSQLFAHTTAKPGTSSSSATSVTSATSTAGKANTLVPGAAVGVIKKKVTGVYLEDSPRGRGELTKSMQSASANTPAAADRYVVPLDASGGEDFDYFSPSAIEKANSEMHEQEHIFNDNDAWNSEEVGEHGEVEEGEVLEVRRPSYKPSSSGKSRSCDRKGQDTGSSSSSDDEHSLSGHHRNGPKLRIRPTYRDLGEDEGDDGNEYYLGSADEAEEGEEEQERNWDKGMLCCNDDQGSTCSATGSSYLLLEDEDELDNSNDNNNDDDDDRDDYRYGNLGAGSSSSGGAGVRGAARRSDSNSSISAGNHSGSSDDEGSDFEVMMNRRRIATHTDNDNDNGNNSPDFINSMDGTIVESEEDFEYA